MTNTRQSQIDKVRASRDGHEFHEAWAARVEEGEYGGEYLLSEKEPYESWVVWPHIQAGLDETDLWTPSDERGSIQEDEWRRDRKPGAEPQHMITKNQLAPSG